MSKADVDGNLKANLRPATRLTLGGRDPFAHHGYVNTPVYHASTLLYRSADDFENRRGPYSYGRRGTPTSEAFEKAIVDLEGPACAGALLMPSGLSAISTAFLAILNAGGMNDGVQQQTHRVYENMAFLTLDLFPRIIAMRIDAGPPFSALFTLWLSMMAAVGLASRSSFSRHAT